MKLEHFFLGITAVLLAATGWMALHYRTEFLLERQKNEFAKVSGNSVPAAPSPAAPTPAATGAGAPKTPGLLENPAAVVAQSTAEADRLQKELDAAEREKLILAEKVKKMEDNKQAGLPADAGPLTDVQIRIKEAPAIAKVKEFVSEAGIAVLDHGKDRSLATGQTYAVRRGHFLVSERLVIGETVDDQECAATVSGLQPGEVIRAGDEVIKWE